MYASEKMTKRSSFTKWLNVFVIERHQLVGSVFDFILLGGPKIINAENKANKANIERIMTKALLFG